MENKDQTFEFDTDTDKLKLQPVFPKFENYCNPRTNTMIIRHKLFTYKQSEGQSFNNFVTELRKLSNKCTFGYLKDSLIKDMIICGVVDNSLRERMLREPDINLKPISSWFRIRIHSFGFGFAVSCSEVEYETGKFKSGSLVFLRKLITLKVKISIFRVFSKI